VAPKPAPAAPRPAKPAAPKAPVAVVRPTHLPKPTPSVIRQPQVQPEREIRSTMSKPRSAAAPEQPIPDDALARLRSRLEQQRQEILDLYKQDLRAGQESADDGTEDIVDRANNSYNRELMFSISDSERQMLFQVEDALRRMDEGVYGRCSNCGRSISLQRLEAVPWARYCIDCQELSEKGLLAENE
jgi:DnaK suppressor protein